MTIYWSQDRLYSVLVSQRKNILLLISWATSSCDIICSCKGLNIALCYYLVTCSALRYVLFKSIVFKSDTLITELAWPSNSIVLIFRAYLLRGFPFPFVVFLPFLVFHELRPPVLISLSERETNDWIWFNYIKAVHHPSLQHGPGMTRAGGIPRY